jgi:hypothetical protein
LTAQPTARDSETINELVSRVTHGFDSPNSPLGLRNHQRNAVTGDARIRQPKHPLGTQKSSTNCCRGSRRDSTAQTNHQRTAVTVDARILQPKQPLGTEKSSTNCCRGSRRDSTAQTNHQRTAVTVDARIRQPKQPLGTVNSSTNCCRGSRRDSTAHTPPRDSEIIYELLSRLTHGIEIPHSP